MNDQVSEEYGDLEKLTESELMEILKSLEADEENEKSSLDEVWLPFFFFCLSNSFFAGARLPAV